MRKSFDGLCALAQHVLLQDPLSGHLFVFVGKTRKRIKILWWDQSGLALFYKRLEKGAFPMPAASTKSGNPLLLTPKDLLLLLDGVSLESVRRHAPVSIPR
jgi:transposase